MLAGHELAYSPAAVVAAGGEKTGDFWADAYPVIPHPAELIVGLIAFAVVYYLAAKFAIPEFEKMYQARRDSIEGGILEAQEAQAEADALLAEYKSQLSKAREDASRIREDARGEAAEIATQVRNQANNDADRILTTAHKQIDAERAQASTQLQGELGRLATELASRIVGESLTDQQLQTRVIDRFLSELETADPGTFRTNGQDS